MVKRWRRCTTFDKTCELLNSHWLSVIFYGLNPSNRELPVSIVKFWLLCPFLSISWLCRKDTIICASTRIWRTKIRFQFCYIYNKAVSNIINYVFEIKNDVFNFHYVIYVCSYLRCHLSQAFFKYFLTSFVILLVLFLATYLFTWVRTSSIGPSSHCKLQNRNPTNNLFLFVFINFLSNLVRV